MAAVSKSRIRRAGVLSGLVAATMMLSACGSNSSDDKSGGDFALNIDDCLNPERATQEITGTLTIGYSAPLSGPVAGPVEISTDGFDARIAQANASGELGDLKLEVSYLDDAFQPDKAKSNGTQFINKDEVDLLTSFGAGQVGAMADDQNAACVPMLYPNSSDVGLSDMEVYPWTAQFLPLASVETKFLVKYIQDNTDKPAVGIAENPTSSGKSQSDAFQDSAEAAGLEITKIVDDTDPAAAATSLKEAGVTVVYHAGVSGSCGTFDAARERAAYEPELIVRASNCINAAEYIAAGEASDGVVVPMYLKDPADPEMAGDAAVKEYLAGVDDAVAPNNALTVGGWVQADLFINTIKQAQKSDDGLTQESIIRAARDQNYASPLLIDGVTWTSSGTTAAGVSGFAPYAWSFADQRFIRAGDIVNVK